MIHALQLLTAAKIYLRNHRIAFASLIATENFSSVTAVVPNNSAVNVNVQKTVLFMLIAIKAIVVFVLPIVTIEQLMQKFFSGESSGKCIVVCYCKNGEISVNVKNCSNPSNTCAELAETDYNCECKCFVDKGICVAICA